MEGWAMLGASPTLGHPSAYISTTAGQTTWRSSPRQGGREEAQADAPLPVAPRRGVGCIHYEMATGRPLFPGSTVKEELHLIFRLLGQSTAPSKCYHQGAPALRPARDLQGLGRAAACSQRGQDLCGQGRSLPPPLHCTPPSRPGPWSLTTPSAPALVSSGTPTEETWPGVTVLSEFCSYSFPRYLPQPLISHAPR